MDSTSTGMMIVMALASGAASGSAEHIVKEGYAALKNLLHNKFAKVNVEPLELRPASKAKQESLAEDLVEAGADKDDQILRAAQELIKLIESRAPEAVAAAGITMRDFTAGGSIELTNFEATGDIILSGFKAGSATEQKKDQAVSSPNA